MQQQKILIFSDSLALARSTPEAVTHDHTWPSLLRTAHQVHQVSVGGGTIVDLVRQAGYHLSYDPDVVVLQYGIVDCAPRFMTKFEMEVVRRIPFLGKRMMKLMNNSTVRKFRNTTYVSLSSFIRHSESMMKLFPGKKILALGIIPATEKYEQLLPGVTANIGRYNGALAKIFGSHFIAMDNFPNNGLMSDHHHVNATGHQYIFDVIQTRILGND